MRSPIAGRLNSICTDRVRISYNFLRLIIFILLFLQITYCPNNVFLNLTLVANKKKDYHHYRHCCLIFKSKRKQNNYEEEAGYKVGKRTRRWRRNIIPIWIILYTCQDLSKNEGHRSRKCQRSVLRSESS